MGTRWALLSSSSPPCRSSWQLMLCCPFTPALWITCQPPPTRPLMWMGVVIELVRLQDINAPVHYLHLPHFESGKLRRQYPILKKKAPGPLRSR